MPDNPIGFSVSITVLVVLAAIFFIVFFSTYIRRCTADAEPSPRSTTTTYASASRRQPQSSELNQGLDVSTVNSLPLVAYTKARTHPMIGDCPICLSEFEERETVRFIPYCSHVFHPTCIDTWLYSHITCPLCRSAQLFKRGEEICLDVKQVKDGNSVHEIDERSTVENCETWRNEGLPRITIV